MTAKTTTFTVTLPTGETAKRGSKTKTYTHAVAVRESGQVAQLLQKITETKAHMETITHPGTLGWYAVKLAEMEAAVEGQQDLQATVAVGDWWIQGWCSRADLAEKLAAKCRKDWGRDVKVLNVN